MIKLLILFFCGALNATLASPPQDSHSNKNLPSKNSFPESRWGLAVGSGWIHDYPGADQGRSRFLLMPVFKGKYITIDRQDGVRSEIVSSGSYEFSVSFSFSFQPQLQTFRHAKVWSI